MLKYDNFEDVKTKLFNTICTYDGKAVWIKDVQQDQENLDNYFLRMGVINERGAKTINFDDPKLNYMHFNIGYSNSNNNGAVWWYRIPHRQYHQGLRSNQVGCIASQPAVMHNAEFSYNYPIYHMLNNEYPTFDEAEKLTRDTKDAHLIIAFNRNFAVAWDKIHRDLILEYKGTLIGCCRSRDKADLLNEYKHLTEAFMEATNAH